MAVTFLDLLTSISMKIHVFSRHKLFSFYSPYSSVTCCTCLSSCSCCTTFSPIWKADGLILKDSICSWISFQRVWSEQVTTFLKMLNMSMPGQCSANPEKSFKDAYVHTNRKTDHNIFFLIRTLLASTLTLALYVYAFLCFILLFLRENIMKGKRKDFLIRWQQLQ